MEIWDAIPNELKLMLFTALPGIGKGIVSIPYGIYKYGFSVEKTVFWCSLGSCIKVAYYFILIYGAEKWFIKKGFLSVQKFEKWREETINRHKTTFDLVGITSLAIIPNLGPGVFTGACLSYFCGVGFLRGALVTVAGTTVGTYIIALGAIYSKPGISAGFEIVKGLF